LIKRFGFDGWYTTIADAKKKLMNGRMDGVDEIMTCFAPPAAEEQSKDDL
jgi:hypothetical protein